MGRWLTTSLIVIACFIFLMAVELGMVPDSIASLIPADISGILIAAAMVVVVLASLYILPLSPKKK